MDLYFCINTSKCYHVLYVNIRATLLQILGVLRSNAHATPFYKFYASHKGRFWTQMFIEQQIRGEFSFIPNAPEK